MILTYTSSAGVVFDLLSFDGLKTESANYHKYTWDRNTSARQFGERLNYFTKNAQIYSATFLFRGSKASRKAKIDSFHFETERDIVNESPGKITWGSHYIECFIVSSSTEPRDDGGVYTENEVEIYCPYPFWIEEKSISIRPTDTDNPHIQTDKGYPSSRSFAYGYPYSYSVDKNAVVFQLGEHYASSNFKMVCWGPASGISINIGGNLYKVDYAIRANQYMVIDSRPLTPANRRAYVVSESGIITNVYDYRDPDYELFKPIPGGNVIINYSRSYGIDLTVYLERSEPK